MPRAWSAALAVAMLGFYLSVTPHVSGDKDAGEISLGLATGGVLHPTGYPMYTILGHAYVALLHALGAGYPFAANTWAGLGAGVALYFYHRLALRVIPGGAPLANAGRFALAALPVLALGLHPVWMAEATMVEVHSWQLAWLCGTALVFAGLCERLARSGPRAAPGAGPAPGHWAARMAAWGFLCGLGGTNHAISVFYAGGLTLALAWALIRAGRMRVWVPLLWLAAGIVPLSSYAYIYLRARHPGHASVWPMLEPSLRGFLGHVTAHSYLQNLGHWDPEASELQELHARVYPILWPGLLLFAASGLAPREGWRRLVAWALTACVAAQLVFVFQYGVTDPSAYFLPGLAVALLCVVPLGARVAARGTASRRFALPAALLLLAVPAIPWIREAAARPRELAQVDDLLLQLWHTVPFDRGIVLWPSGNHCRLKEFQEFRGDKRGIDVYATAVLCNDYPRAVFRRKYGFDPMANVDAGHLSQPLKPEFVIGQQTSEFERHYFALVHEAIVDSALVPVAAFDAPYSIRVFRPVRNAAAATHSAPEGGRPARR